MLKYAAIGAPLQVGYMVLVFDGASRRSTKKVWTPKVAPGSPEAAALAQFLKELTEVGSDVDGDWAKAEAFHRKWGMFAGKRCKVEGVARVAQGYRWVPVKVAVASAPV